jgi:hypothetical protein
MESSFELGGGQFDRLSLPSNEMARLINQEIAKLQRAGRFGWALPSGENFLDPEYQLTRAERFGQVIIRPELQTENPVESPPPSR